MMNRMSPCGKTDERTLDESCLTEPASNSLVPPCRGGGEDGGNAVVAPISLISHVVRLLCAGDGDIFHTVSGGGERRVGESRRYG